MGHDYSLFISWANDFNYAFQNYGVFNIIFTPQRCGGVPVWSNPIGLNFSVFHLLSIILKDIYAIAFYVILYVTLSYFSMKKFLTLFNLKGLWNHYICIGWCTQGYIVTRAAVGHLTYINIGLWPFYAYILLKKNNSLKKDLLGVLVVSILYSHDIYSANPYLFTMFPISFFVLCIIFKMNGENFSVKKLIIKTFFTLFFSFLIILPKILATHEFTKNFQRSVTFSKVGIVESANYVFMNFLVPIPIDYKSLTGWWYGNWESVSYIFPQMFLLIFLNCSISIKRNKRIILSFLFLFFTAIIVIGGVYADLILSLPLLKSFHVNPRWMPLLSLGIVSLVCFYLKENHFPNWVALILIFFALITPFLYLDKDYLLINYSYRSGIDIENNRLNYCYEPIFGYNLELLPISKIRGVYADPRCYLGNQKCSDFTLPQKLYKDLEHYQLKPFKF